MPLRLLVVDDHPVVRKGVRVLLESQPGWQVVAECSTGREAVEAAHKYHPDIVVLDLSLPELNGLEATRRIKSDLPRVQVLVLTMHHSEELARQVLAAGARGYVLKSDADQQLVAAVRSLEEHRPFLTSTVTELVLDNYLRQGERDVTEATLTSREREIVQLIAEGKSSKEMATSLELSIKTVESHRANVMRKLRVKSATEVVRYAIRNGMVQP